MDYFLTADEHFGHENIIKFCDRPFDNVEDMREGLIHNFNSRVSTRSTTFHLGDMFWRKLQVQDCVDIMKRLNGHHVYINGNHEEVFYRGDSHLLTKCFEQVYDVYMLKHEKKRLWMSHYAHRSWPKSGDGSYHAFGHTHGVLEDFGRSHDVGVDANDYAPVSFDELVKIGDLSKAFEEVTEKNRELLKGLSDAGHTL